MKNRLRSIAAEHRLPLVTGIGLQTLQSYIGLMTIVFFQRIIDTFLKPGGSDLPRALGVYIGLTALNHLLIYA